MSAEKSWAHRIGLGTAQFGLPYGISNQNGRVPGNEVRRILQRAVAAGICLIDTAPTYGDAEEILAAALPEGGGSLSIATKTIPLKEGLGRVIARSRASRDTFRRPVDLIVHCAGDLEGSCGEDLWTALLALKAQGVCRRIGISAYVEDHVLALAEKFRPDFMQVPCSLADQRLVVDGTLSRLKDRGIEVHLRSIFLQGLLLMPPERLPGGLSRVAPWLKAARSRAEDLGISMLEASLHYAASLKEADILILGVTSVGELEDILAVANAQTPEHIDWPAWRLDDAVALSPARWKELGA